MESVYNLAYYIQGYQILRKTNLKCIIDGVTLIKMGINLPIYLTSFSSSDAVKTLTKPRHLDGALLFHGLGLLIAFFNTVGNAHKKLNKNSKKS